MPRPTTTPKIAYPPQQSQAQPRGHLQERSITYFPASSQSQSMLPPQPKNLPIGPFSYLPTPFRQLQPPKSPLYRPAVLRSIERPAKRDNSALTPPESPSSSGDRKSCAGLAIKSGGRYGFFGEHFSSAGLLEEGKVTGRPTREHWKVFESPMRENISCRSHPLYHTLRTRIWRLLAGD